MNRWWEWRLGIILPSPHLSRNMRMKLLDQSLFGRWSSTNPVRHFGIGQYLEENHLVGGLEHDFYSSIYWEFRKFIHHPNWRVLTFFRGLGFNQQPFLTSSHPSQVALEDNGRKRYISSRPSPKEDVLSDLQSAWIHVTGIASGNDCSIAIKCY